VTSAHEALRDLGEAQCEANLYRYAGTYGAIKALVEMVTDGSRTPDEILPRIQEAIAEHERDDKAARTEFRERQAELVVQVRAERAELDRRLAESKAAEADLRTKEYRDG
jgi:hypothetical protein